MTFPKRNRTPQLVPALASRGVQVLSRVSHVHVFLFGWAYYLALPVAAGALGAFDNVEQASNFLAPFQTFNARWFAMLVYVMLAPVFYSAGSRVAGTVRKLPVLRVRSVNAANALLLPFYGLLLSVYTIQARGLLFGGYVAGYDASLMGPLATVEIALTFQYVLAASANRILAKRVAGWLLAVTSLVLLSMGGRIYVASALTALFFYKWKWDIHSHSRRRRLFRWALIAPLLLAAVGMLRLGTFDLSGLGFFLFAEPVFTSISGLTFMLDDQWKWLTIPHEFMGAFLNIVPTSIWPEKTDHLQTLSDYYPEFVSPFGAQSVITTTVGNFGYIGGLLFILAVGLFMGLCAKAAGAAKGSAPRALYCFLIGLLPFIFFRESFQIQVKLVVTGLLLTLLHLVLASLVSRKPLASLGAVAAN